MKTTYTSAFKAQIVLELLKEKTISQLAAEYKVHPNVLRDWRTIAVQNLTSLTTQLSWIKQQSGLDRDKS
jgi:transposase-like protein